MTLLDTWILITLACTVLFVSLIVFWGLDRAGRREHILAMRKLECELKGKELQETRLMTESLDRVRVAEATGVAEPVHKPLARCSHGVIIQDLQD